MELLAKLKLQKNIHFIALISGAIMPFAFAPIGIYSIAILSLAGLLFCWHQSNPTQAFLTGLLFGIGMFGVGVSWVFVSIHVFGGTNALLAAVFTALFVIVLALFMATNGYLLRKIFPGDHLAIWLLAFPASWALFEWLRSWLFTGFPWLLVGYSQTSSPLKGFAPIVGIYGVTFLVAFCSSLLFVGLKSIKNRLVLCLLIIGMIWGVGTEASKILWTKPFGNIIHASLIQGDIPQSTKWDPEQIKPTLKTYFDLSNNNYMNSDLIIWPEAAIPLPKRYAESYLEALQVRAAKHHDALLTGIPIEADKDHYYNAMIALGNGVGTYYKRHLVPFGEYVPFESLLRGVINFFNLPMSSFIPGPANQLTVQADHITIAPFICYEIAYSNLILDSARKAQLLVLISNDSWFGHSFAPAQHLQIAQFAALETGRFMAVATNSGITATIGPRGKIRARLQQFKTDVLHARLQAMNGNTPWMVIGNLPILLILFGLLLGCYWLVL